MPLTAEKLSSVIADLLAEYQSDRERLDEIAGYCANEIRSVYVPRGATAEYKQIVDQARFNVLPLVVKALAQNLFIDGYRPTSATGRAPSTDNAPIWDKVWQPNRMDARQSSIWRSAIKFGYSYATVVPGSPGPVITPYSPRKLVALYDDKLNDEWPVSAMVIHRPMSKKSGRKVKSAEPDVGAKLTVFDAEFIYDVTKGDRGWEVVANAKEHGLGVPPVVRFLDEWDSDEMPKGKIEPLLPNQRQLNQTTFSLLMAEHYGAFVQRWVTGMKDDSPPFRVRVDAMLSSDSADTKFGEFGQTDLSGYLNSREKQLLFVTAVSQIPPHQLVIGSGISNISAEALVALQTAHDHDIGEHKTSFGESAEQLLRLSGKAMGGEDGDAAWKDTSAQVVWRDTTPRSLAQVADALGKLATQLGVPPRALWQLIPGVTDQDLATWEEMLKEQDLMGDLPSLLDGETPAGATEASDIKAKADALGALVRAGAEFESSAEKVGLEGVKSSGAVPTTLRLPESDAATLEQS